VVRPTKRPPSLRAQALAWLAQREHSRHELGGKLARWIARLQREAASAVDDDVGAGREPGVDARRPLAAAAAPLPSVAEIESLLDALEQAGHLSDRRFVESRVHARASRFGTLRIQLELRQLGAGADEATLAQLKASETERARGVWEARFGHPPADAAERARQSRFLAGRGFSAEAIRRVVCPPIDDE